MEPNCWSKSIRLFPLFIIACFLLLFPLVGTIAAAENPAPPPNPVKLVFIHHSCGENWLTDGNGNLGKQLGKNNYVVSDTNYGWGPNSIGDRTDIVNWPEWFTRSGSSRNMQALFQLNDKNSSYSRSLKNPGGENRIIMFKSCYPNSELGGRPGDPPKKGGDLTVGNAKAIYNELLQYFGQRPDKLFIAVTAPPVLDRSRSSNARAFNNWLVNNWLKGYNGKNVAVFDFYNVLTGPDNHHRFRNGRIEHTTQKGRNTLYYPTGGDEHPTAKGNRKATAEFVPLLNVYYQRWQAWLPSAPEPVVRQTASPEATHEESPPDEPEPVHTPAPVSSITAKPGAVIDDFEGEPHEWQVFSDEGQSKTRLSCGAVRDGRFNGKSGLFIEYDVAPDSWATCSLVLSNPESWKMARGISLKVQAEHPGQEFAVVAYNGDGGSKLLHFEYIIQGSTDNIGKWQQLELTWDMLEQPSWEGNGKYDTTKAKGVGFAFGAPPDSNHAGKVWVDDIRFLP